MKKSENIFDNYEFKPSDFVATEADLLAITGEISESKVVKSEKVKAELADEKKPTIEIVESSSSEKDLQTDYNYIRNNLYTITEKSISALENLVDIAQQSQHPRAYEVISLMVNTIASAQKDLMTIHKDKNKIESDSGKSEKTDVVNNNLFIGNTAQLDEIIANMTKKKLSE
jgi:hypothetical protein